MNKEWRCGTEVDYPKFQQPLKPEVWCRLVELCSVWRFV